MKSLAIMLLVGVLWAVGLLAFAARVERSTPAPEPATADAVVALTGGGSARLEAAMRLLEQGKGRRLLITGVNPETTREDIRRVIRAYNRIYDCCVDLDWRAEDTTGNAEETARWIRANGYRRVILVTADFHMPRALVELRALSPQAEFIAHPVATPALDAGRWTRSRANATTLVGEYLKYLAVLGREAVIGLGPREAPRERAPRAVAARA